MNWKYLAPLPIAIIAATTVLERPVFADREEAIEKIEKAIEVYETMLADPETRIPASLIADSQGIAIIPNLKQAGVIFGGRRGTGTLVRRLPDGSWSDPVFINMTGGSFGLQIGASSNDIVLLFMTQEAVTQLLGGDFEFGGNVAGVAGPVGATPVDPAAARSNVLSYSTTSGLFGGVAVEGGEIGFNNNLNEDFYGSSEVVPEVILGELNPETPAIADQLRQVLLTSEE